MEELSDGASALFAKYLRLVGLSGYFVKKKLPHSIHSLKQLRYLKAPGIQDQVFPRSPRANKAPHPARVANFFFTTVLRHVFR